MKKKIAVIVSSKNDLKYCHGGLQFLLNREEEVYGIISGGVYVRNPDSHIDEIETLMKDLINLNVDIVIVASSDSASLIRMCEAYLRFSFKTKRITVIGVALQTRQNPGQALLIIGSLSTLGQNVIFKDGTKLFIASEGFMDACIYAVDQTMPKISFLKSTPSKDYSLNEAIYIASH